MWWRGRFVPLSASVAGLLCWAVALQAAPALHTISIRSDGRDELQISNGALIVQHFSWSLPTELTIDGVSQPLTWNGNTSLPIAVPTIAGDYWVTQSKGRDQAYAVQRSNGFVLTADDNPNGSDVYEYQLYAAPQANTADWMYVRGAGATPGHMNLAGATGYVPWPAGAATTFSLTVDGTDKLTITGGNLQIQHIAWSNPTSLMINGVPQPLTFNNNLSDAIPLSLPDDLQFTQLGGRSALYAVQTPLGLTIGADDELVGADVYTWAVTAVPEPSSSLLFIGIGALSFIGRRRRK
jgi:hypothetical protein